MDHPHRFKKFLEQIRPSSAQLIQFRRAHTELRRRIARDPDLRDRIVATFLQGSYRRSTAIRGTDGRGVSDVDVVVVTDLDPVHHLPERVLTRLSPFLREHYPRARVQGRSVRVQMDGVALDLVLTSAPSRVDLLRQETGAEPLEDALEVTPAELAAWQSEPLLIPDRDARRWQSTHPMAQLAATRKKNEVCNGHYVNVVKAIKWWQLITPGMPEHPRGYPLERVVEACCPEDIDSVAEGVARTLEVIAARYRNRRKPKLAGHNMPGQDVLARVTEEEFAAFVVKVAASARQARQALDCQDEGESVALWRALLGEAFPGGPVLAPIEAPAAAPVVVAQRSLSLEDVAATLAERGQLVVEGFQQLSRIKRTLERAVQQLGIRVVVDPSTPAELLDQLGVTLLSAFEGGLKGAVVGLLAGLVLGRPKELMAVGAAVGAVVGAAQGPERVKAGWRLRGGYNEVGEVFVELKLLT